MTKRRIHIAVPAYSGQVACATALTIIRASNECVAEGWDCAIAFRAGDSLLERARNTMLYEFLETGADDLLWWDSDIAPVPGAVPRILKHDVDFVGGCYRTRNDPAEYIVNLIDGCLDENPENGLIEVRSLPGGFLRVTRKALLQAMEFHSDLWIIDGGKKIPWLFQFLLKNHQFYGEDIMFCERMREAGVKLWLDHLLPFHHIGTKTYFGRYDHHRGRQIAARTTPEQIEEAQARLKARLADIEREAFPLAAE